MNPRTLRVSTRNAAFQVFESLRTNRQKRSATGTFLVEGVRPVTMAIEHGWEVEALIYDGGRPRSAWAGGRPRGAARRRALRDDDGARRRTLGQGRRLGSHRRGAHARGDVLAALPLRPDLLLMVADRPSSPGNLGTLIRSCDALGAHALVVTGHGADAHDPGAITASRGSVFALPVLRADSGSEVVAFAARAREALGTCRLVGADEAGTVAVDACDLTGPTIVVAGNEAHGLSRAYKDACDTLVRIPMTGAASSLNIAVAASIVLYEASRQRRGA